MRAKVHVGAETSYIFVIIYFHGFSGQTDHGVEPIQGSQDLDVGLS